MNVLKNTEMYSLKWFIFCWVNSRSIKKKLQEIKKPEAKVLLWPKGLIAPAKYLLDLISYFCPHRAPVTPPSGPLL